MSQQGITDASTAQDGAVLHYPAIWNHDPEPMLNRYLSVAHHNWMRDQRGLEREANVAYLRSSLRERRHASGVA